MKNNIKQKGLLDYTKVFTHLFIISVIFAVVILATNTASAISSGTISIGSARMDKDSTTVLELSIANAVEITGLSLDVSYDPAVVEVQDIYVNEDVTGSTVTSDIDNTAGKIGIVIINTDMINSVESVPMIDITVHAIGEAGDETTLSLQNVEISDVTFSPITVKSIVNGFVKINNGNLVLSDTVSSEIEDNITLELSTSPQASIQNKSLYNVGTNLTNDKSNGDESAARDVSISSQADSQNNDTSDISSAIDQPEPATPGFGWVLTIMNLLFMIKIFRKNEMK